MTYAAHRKDFAPCVDDGAIPKSDDGTKKPGVLRRMIDAIYEWPQRQADREIGCLIERSGGRLTDDLERRMMRRLSMWDWNAHD
ncbi:hypothetical protein SAMN05444161_8872 [Rhizobiales bacterium GAS191]|nr:hypothetical protein SAMN05444161_8872 [Rhizobiales bacterium GAS191]